MSDFVPVLLSVSSRSAAMHSLQRRLNTKVHVVVIRCLTDLQSVGGSSIGSVRSSISVTTHLRLEFKEVFND